MKYETPRLRRRLFAVNHPRYADAIHQHPEFRRPERLLQWHLHFPACCQLVENPLRFRRVLRAHRKRKALGFFIAVWRRIRAHQHRVPHRHARMHDLLAPVGRRLVRHWRIPKRHRHLDFSTQALFIKFKRLFASPIEHQIRRYLCLTRGNGCLFHSGLTHFLPPSKTLKLPSSKRQSANLTCSLQVIIATILCAFQTARFQPPLRMPPQRLRRNARRPLVPLDPPRHDVARLPLLQGIPYLLRRHRHQHPFRSSEKVDRIWHHRRPRRSLRWPQADLCFDAQGPRSRSRPHRNGSLGRQARRNRQSTSRPPDAKGQRAIYRSRPPALHRKNTFLRLIARLAATRFYFTRASGPVQ